MSLPARQERVLNLIERSLHVCDPGLGSMFAIFTELARGEEMPWLEQLGSRSSLFRRWRNRRQRPRRRERALAGAWMTGAPSTSLRMIILATAVLLALVPAVVFGFSTRTGSPCGPAIRPEHSTAALNGAKACPPVMQRMATTTEPMSP